MAPRINITCCNKCEDRKPGCHATCERYQKQREELDKTNETVKSNKKKDNSYISGPKKRGLDKFKKTKERQR